MRKSPEMVQLLTDPMHRRMELEATMWAGVQAYDRGTASIERIMGSMRDLLADLKLADDARDMAMDWNAKVQE